MDKKEFVKRWKKELKMKNGWPVYIELNDGSVLHITRFVFSRDFSGHIKLFLDNLWIGHIPISSIKEVF